jgi:hypothetical protein
MYSKINIQDLTEARNTVEQFYAKLNFQFAQLSAVIIDKHSKKSNIENTSNISNADQSLFETIEVSERLDPCVNVFLNNQIFKKNSDKEKQDQLLARYRAKDWNDPIFFGADFIELALALYLGGRIKNPEFETLQQLHHAILDVNQFTADATKKANVKGIPRGSDLTFEVNQILHFHTVLDENNEFTSDAQNLIIKNLPGYMSQPFNSIQINNFKLLIQAFFELYPSENMFISVLADHFPVDPYIRTIAFAPQCSILIDGLKKDSGIDKLFYDYANHKGRKILLLSCLVNDALQLSCFPVDEIVSMRSVAGTLHPKDIERGLKFNIQFGAVTIPGVLKNTSAHDIATTSTGDAGHDRYHSHARTRQGAMARRALARMVDLSRSELLSRCAKFQDIEQQFLLSLLTWQLIDADFSEYDKAEYYNHAMTQQEKINLFFCAIYSQYHVNFIFKFEQNGVPNQVTDFGISVFIDMAKNKNFWSSLFGMDLSHLPDHYNRHLLIIEKLIKKSYFTDDLKHNIILFRAYFEFGETHIDAFHQVFLKHGDQLKNALVFERDNTKKFLGLIDSRLPQSSLSEIFAFTAITYLLPIQFSKVHPSFFETKNLDLFKHIFLLFLYFNHNHDHLLPGIQKYIIDAFIPLLRSLVENNIILDKDKFKDAVRSATLVLKYYVEPKSIDSNNFFQSVTSDVGCQKTASFTQNHCPGNESIF